MIDSGQSCRGCAAGWRSSGGGRTMGGDTFPGGGGHAPHEGLSMKYVCKILGILDHCPLLLRPHFQYCLSATSAEFLTPPPSLRTYLMDGSLSGR